MSSVDGTAGSPPRRRGAVITLLPRYALLIALVVAFVTFSLTLPSFASPDNLRNMLNEQVTVVILAVGVVFPLAVGEFDLSVGTVVGLGQAMVIGLVSLQGFSVPAAIALTLVIGCAVGVVNGVLITKLNVASLVATLATGSVVTGIVYWYTNSTIIFEGVPRSLVDLGRGDVLGVPLPVVYGAAICVLAGIFLQRLPTGRRLYAIGGNRTAAQVIGINVHRLTILAFVLSAFAASIAGAVTGARMASASPSLGPELLLPAYSAAFLGATAFQPGRFNVAGAVVGVLFLAVTSAGLQQHGVASWSSYVFNGLALCLAVALSEQASRARTALARRDRLRELRAATTGDATGEA